MNCPTCESLLLRDQDGALTDQERAALPAHLSQCPACRDFAQQLPKLSSAIRAESDAIRVPDAAAEWAQLQTRINASTPRVAIIRRIPSRVWWLGAPLAAAAALALIFVTPSQTTTATNDLEARSDSGITHVDYVESGDPNASTMVYVDQESGWLVVWTSNSRAITNG